ncbi:MAG: hypothetical protein AAF960_07760 [Bacteroidota bacterium]
MPSVPTTLNTDIVTNMALLYEAIDPTFDGASYNITFTSDPEIQRKIDGEYEGSVTVEQLGLTTQTPAKLVIFNSGKDCSLTINLDYDWTYSKSFPLKKSNGDTSTNLLNHLSFSKPSIGDTPPPPPHWFCIQTNSHNDLDAGFHFTGHVNIIQTTSSLDVNKYWSNVNGGKLGNMTMSVNGTIKYKIAQIENNNEFRLQYHGVPGRTKKIPFLGKFTQEGVIILSHIGPKPELQVVYGIGNSAKLTILGKDLAFNEINPIDSDSKDLTMYELSRIPGKVGLYFKDVTSTFDLTDEIPLKEKGVFKNIHFDALSITLDSSGSGTLPKIPYVSGQGSAKFSAVTFESLLVLNLKKGFKWQWIGDLHPSSNGNLSADTSEGFPFEALQEIHPDLDLSELEASLASLLQDSSGRNANASFRFKKAFIEINNLSGKVQLARFEAEAMATVGSFTIDLDIKKN